GCEDGAETRKGEERVAARGGPLGQGGPKGGGGGGAFGGDGAVGVRSGTRQGGRLACRRARRAERPDHEGGATACHHPRGVSRRICRRAWPAPEPRPAHGLALRAAPHGCRAWSRLGIEVRNIRA